MKSMIKHISALAVVLSAAATIAWSGPGDGAQQQWEYDTVISDGAFAVYVPCLGENVRFYGEAPYRRHTVTTASGNTSFKLQFLPQTPNLLPFVAIGELSGTVYYFANGHPYNESFHAGPGETHSFHARDVFISDEGVRLNGSFILHTTINANGRIVVDELELEELDCD